MKCFAFPCCAPTARAWTLRQCVSLRGFGHVFISGFWGELFCAVREETDLVSAKHESVVL